MDKDFFEISLSEAKDHLRHINNSIKDTRDKVFFLVGLVFAITGYLSTDIFSLEYNSFKSNALFVTIPFVIVIFIFCRHAIIPMSLRFDGTDPETMKEIYEDEDTDFRASILYGYTVSINTNAGHLIRIAKGYNRSCITLVLWLFFIGLLFCKRLITFSGVFNFLFC